MTENGRQDAMPDSSLDVRQYVTFLMGALASRGSKVLEEYLKDYDLNVGSFYILSLISARTGNRKMSQKQVAEALQMNVNTITRYLDDMARKGLANRVPNPDNRKENLIEVTAEGLRSVRAAHGSIGSLRNRFETALGPKEYQSLLQLLNNLYNFDWTEF